MASFASAASAQDLDAITRETTTIEGQVDALVREPLEEQGRRSPTHVEERLTDGELFYRLQDYVRSSIIFTDIVDNYPQHEAYSDALFLLADSLFRAGDYLGARTRFREVISRSNDPRFRPYVQRALGRLIEIAIHTRNFDGVEEVFRQLSSLPPAEVEAATSYFRAKYLFNRAVPTEDVLRDPAARARIDTAQLDQARAAFEAVTAGSPYYPQALYFIGVIYTVREQYPQAIDAFTRVLRTEATTPEHEEVAELSHLALGRLYYETDQLAQAVEAYQAVSRTSSRFDVALYELAWVHIRRGDSVRAERALEVLTLASPDSRYIPDGKLLRGNLLLRNGRLEEAERVFQEVYREFNPVRRDLDEMLRAHDTDPLAYFRSLVHDNLEVFDANAFLPPAAQRWGRLEGDMDRALDTLADLAQARQLVNETSQLVERLTAALAAPNRVAVFADLRRQLERSTQLHNRITQTRRRLLATEGGTGELADVRRQRRELERYLDDMPTTDEGIAAQDDEILGQVRRLERELARLEVELLGIEARVTGIEHYLDSPNRTPVPDADAAVRAEAANHRASVREYRRQIEELRVALESARLQVGVGDDRYRRQGRIREEYNRLIAREQALGGGDSRSEDLLRRLSAAERRLDQRDGELERVANERSTEIRRQVDEESQRIVGYQQELAALDTEAEDVVGAVTYHNFRLVQHRFYDLVLRADVGRIDVAWAVREEHRMRVELLTRERQREIQALDDDFREIMDESAPGSSGSSGSSEGTASGGTSGGESAAPSSEGTTP
ncbi:MAG: tetratricopeptide repeat protein [Sandaracinaceae bacterium]|nr:tetratricopeptide repeat protein [Sandaracinaceae bacterium]